MIIDTNPMDALLGLKVSRKPYAIFFKSTACRACRLYKTKVKTLAEDMDGKMDIVVVNIGVDKEAIQEYSIREIPQIIFFVGPAEKKRIKGFADYQKIVDTAKSILA